MLMGWLRMGGAAIWGPLPSGGPVAFLTKHERIPAVVSEGRSHNVGVPVVVSDHRHLLHVPADLERPQSGYHPPDLACARSGPGSKGDHGVDPIQAPGCCGRGA